MNMLKVFLLELSFVLLGVGIIVSLVKREAFFVSDKMLLRKLRDHNLLVVLLNFMQVLQIVRIHFDMGKLF